MTTLEDDFFMDETAWSVIDKLEEELSSRKNSTQPPPPPLLTTTHTTTSTSIPNTIAITTSSAMAYLPSAPQSRTFTRTWRYPERSANTTCVTDVCYSPPPELSQCLIETDEVSSETSQERFLTTWHESENERLKKELVLASKQLAGLEQECLKLRERDKEQQLQSLLSRGGACESECVFSRNGTLKSGGTVPEKPVVSLHKNQNVLGGHIGSGIEKAHKTIGILTDKDGDHVSPIFEGDASFNSDLPRQLLTIWSSSSSQSSRRNFIVRLLETCGSDFCALFSFLSMNMSSGVMDSIKIKHSSHLTPLNCADSSGTRDVSSLFSLLTEFTNDAVSVEALLDILLDLCSHQNVSVVHRTLHTLHVLLELMLPLDKMFGQRSELHNSSCSETYFEHGIWNCTTEYNLIRNNIKVEGLLSEKDGSYHFGFERKMLGDIHDAIKECTSSSGVTSVFHTAYMDKNKLWDLRNGVTISHADKVRVFKEMLHIAVTRWGEEHVQLQAITIMNTIIRGSNAYTEREMFGGTLVFEAVGELLKKEDASCSQKEAFSRLQKEAVQLLYLLLNCPKLLATFCSVSEQEVHSIGVPNEGSSTAGVCVSNVILDGLALCISRSAKDEQDLLLCRKAIVVLAFLASSGKPGFEILLLQRLPSRANFLHLILQVLASEVDAEASENCTTPESSKERTLLMREALILLNRLASHPTYSTAVLQVLTGSGDMASLSIDIATRLSRKSRQWTKCDSITKQMRESEIVNLARVFLKRIFVFLGARI